jgi:BMFP domain-containing protein YqiC
MLDKISLDDLARRLAEVIPADLRSMREDWEKNFHAILQSAFERMNLVSREEFEVQRAVLARTREKLEELEAKITELEQQFLNR